MGQVIKEFQQTYGRNRYSLDRAVPILGGHAPAGGVGGYPEPRYGDVA